MGGPEALDGGRDGTEGGGGFGVDLAVLVRGTVARAMCGPPTAVRAGSTFECEAPPARSIDASIPSSLTRCERTQAAGVVCVTPPGDAADVPVIAVGAALEAASMVAVAVRGIGCAEGWE